ncbi:MAG: RecQ family ATP-dependent DNA helicase [Candidatus Kapabacteria bacterium]|nr:RecQ family ATP-dependent DNA helicase [Candidatus Kapabacteria bacterium]
MHHSPDDILNRYFGFAGFRNGQREIIDAVLAGDDTLVVMPTGGGKSLCYQVPALMKEGTALVVSPLIALMKDQVDALERNNIPATFINSSLHFGDIQRRMALAKQGAYKLLYVAPERLESKQFIEQLASVNISFLAVDEAHCISEWGHDFRPSYLNIPKAVASMKRTAVIALTATATPDVQGDIVRALAMPSPKKFIRGFDRPNLSYITEREPKKAERSAEIIRSTPDGSTIIYCGSRKRVEETAQTLMRLGIRCDAYHAGMNEQLRTSVQEKFINGDSRVLTATSAFGMGVDKRDVRNVIHFDLTQTLEAYYQEAGRAGRDGEPSRCIMLYQPSDRKLQDFFISSTYPEEATVHAVYTFIYDRLNTARGQKPIAPLLMDDTAIANAMNLASMQVSSVVNLLERNGILRRGSQQSTAQLEITAQRERLIEYFNNTTRERKAVLEAILRSVGSEAIGSNVSIDIEAILRKHHIPYEQFVIAMRSFEYARLLRYNAPSSSGGLTVVAERTPPGLMPVDFHSLAERRERAIKKLDVVQRYAETHECKRNFILQYFQEEDIGSRCGKCSSCVAPEVRKIRLDEEGEFVLRNILEVVSELDGKFGRTAVAEVLRGTVSAKVKLFGLERSTKFGTLKTFSRKELIERIDEAIQQRFLMLSANLHPTVMLAPLGTKKLGPAKPSAMTIDIPSSGSRDVSLLVSKLKRVRDELAARNGTAVYAIATDEQLFAIAARPPRTLADFADVRGVGELFMTRWAAEFLYAINSERSNTDDDQDGDGISATVRTSVEYARKGYSLQKIAQMRSMSAGTVAQHLQDAIERGLELDMHALVSARLYENVRLVLLKRPRALLKDIREELGGDTDYALLRVAVAFARRALALHEI